MNVDHSQLNQLKHFTQFAQFSVETNTLNAIAIVDAHTAGNLARMEAAKDKSINGASNLRAFKAFVSKT